MTARTPAETLRAAADRLDELAAGTSPQPWEPNENYPDAWLVRASDGYELVKESGDGDITGPDAAWIAALGPQVAAPLSAWLRAEAACVDSTVVMQSALPKLAEGVEELATGKPSPGWRMRVAVSSADEAVAFALAVLGETPTPDTRED